MKDFLEKHTIQLTAIGPLFIGSGNQLMKKEYVLNKRKHRAYVIDQRKFYQFLDKHRLMDDYESFILSNNNGSLQNWLAAHKISETQLKAFTDYELDCSDTAELKKSTLLTFQKDAYGMPYVPGSSLKGALRTVLLGAEISKSPQKYAALQNKLKSSVMQNSQKKQDKTYLSKENSEIEAIYFNTKDKTKSKTDAVNDIMSGVRVSDSKSLPKDSLTLCPKIDVVTNGDEKELNITRECLRPETKVTFDLVLDRTECSLDIKSLRDSVNVFLRTYNELFLQYFEKETLFDQDVIYLGGGSGFASKTIIHQLLANDAQRVKLVSNIIDATLGAKIKNQHKHFRDAHLGVSPHMCKLTQFDGGLYQMGACRIEIV